LKYSQLIQILRINPEIPVAVRFAAVIAARVNQRWPTQNGAKATLAARKPASQR
jgi:hypothetical protein